MFDRGNDAPRVGKQEYKQREPGLRTELLRVQYELRDADFALVLVLAGNDVEGLHDEINVLHEWMDARLIDAYAFTEPGPEEHERPPLWRYWNAVPARGRTAIFLGGWTQRRILDRLRKELGPKELERALEHDVRFEETLVADGALVLKIWLHLSPEEVKARRRKRGGAPKTLLHRPSIELLRRPAEGLKVAEPVLERMNIPCAPWHVIRGLDVEHRRLEVGRLVAEALDRRLRAGCPQPPTATAQPADAAPPRALAAIDLARRADKDTYEPELERLQRELWSLSCAAIEADLPIVLAFEGWDAAGKGGTIRRLTRGMPATSYRVIPISAPSPEERARPWQWRFWRALPRAGRCTIFDRSWYGRVLVERVEGFASEEAWRRAYGEIVDFERQLVESGAYLAKFWLHISPEEQLRRFEARKSVPFKKYKLTEEDFRNRGRWDEYVAAADEMVARTSQVAPWHLLPAEDKRVARLEVLRRVIADLEERVG